MAHGGGDGTVSPNRKDALPLQSRLFTSISSVYTEVLNLRILLLDNFTKRKDKVGSQIFKICFLVHFVFKT